MVAVRTLTFLELSAYRDHLNRLDTHDRYLRFGCHYNEEAVQRYVDGIKLVDDRIFAVFNDKLEIIGAAHVVKMKDGIAEVGLSVQKDQRGTGIGTALFHKAVEWAQNRGMNKLFTQCLAENSWMMRKAKKEGMSIRIECGETEAYLPLEQANPLTVAHEIIEESFGWLDYGMKAALRGAA